MKDKFITDYPELLKEWDFEKNKGLDPSKVSFGTHLKVWWKCKNGHSWQSIVSNRTRLGRSCPYCSHQKAITGETDLLTKYPEIAKELHPTKNGLINPSKIMPGTHKKYWFKCSKCGYEWEAQLKSRVSGCGCPVCSGVKIRKGFNDCATLHPELVKEWHPIKNGNIKLSEIGVGGAKLYWWICPHGHEYQMSIQSKVRGSKCSVCAKMDRTSFPEQAILYYVKKYFPDAINSYKEIFKNSMELDIFIPSIKTGIEYDGLAWHSSKSNIERDIRKYKICQQNGISLIRVREKNYETEIKSCDVLLVLDNPSESRYLNREIYHVLQSALSTQRLMKGLFFQEKKTFIEQLKESISLMDIDVDRDKRLIQEYLVNFQNSLGDQRPDLVEEWNYEKNKPLTPFNVKPRCNEIVWWKCKKCGFEWQTSVSERNGGKGHRTNCPKCANTIGGLKHHEFVLKKKGSIAKTHPHLLEKWDFEKNTISPYDVVAGSGKKAWWKCKKCGYSYQTTICHMTARNSGCPACGNKVCVPGNNDIATKYPKLILDWDYKKNTIDPTKATIAGIKPFWKCHKCGHEWQALASVRAKGTGCPKCAIEKRKGNSFAKKKQ